MRAIITCVGYDDFLRITLPRTLEHSTKVSVLTSDDDLATRDYIFAMRNRWRTVDKPKRRKRGRSYKKGDMASLHWCPMREFYENDSPFNKGRALDSAVEFQAVTEQLHGWLCILDADILLPEKMDLRELDPDCLYSPIRRMMTEPGPIPPEDQWSELPVGPEQRNGELFKEQFGIGVGYSGYFHLFHTANLGPPPWYESPMWTTAQGCDTVFTMGWPSQQFKRLPFEVLHLGLPRVNWSGRVSERWEIPDHTEPGGGHDANESSS